MSTILNYLYFAVLGLVAALTVARLCYSAYRRQITSAPILPIASIRPGMSVRITGTIERLGETLVGPLSGRECVHFAGDVAETRRYQGDNVWVSLHDLDRSVDFILRDPTGSVVVRIGWSQILSRADYRHITGFGSAPTPAEEAFIERFRADQEGVLDLDRSLCFTERALEIGEEVTVLGTVRRGEGEGEGEGVLEIHAPQDGPLLISDERNVVRSERVKMS